MRGAQNCSEPLSSLINGTLRKRHYFPLSQAAPTEILLQEVIFKIISYLNSPATYQLTLLCTNLKKQTGTQAVSWDTESFHNLQLTAHRRRMI